MNKFKLFILSISLLGLCGCVKNDEKSTNSSVESINSSFQVNDSTRYESTTWDENVQKIINYSVGEEGNVVPSFPAEKYVTYVDKVVTSDYLTGEAIELPSTRIVVSPVDEECIETYGNILLRNDFNYSEDHDLFYAKANGTDMIYVSMEYFDVTPNGTMNIQIYRKKIRDGEWDKNLALIMVGEEIPYIDCEAYEYYFDAYSMVLDIYFINVSDVQITTYMEALTEAGWKKSEVTSVSDTFISKDGFSKIVVTSGVDSFDDTYLNLSLTSEWPYYFLFASIGEDLPKLEGSEVIYDGYTTNELSDGTYYTDIGYKNASVTDFERYCALMKQAGWNTFKPSDGSDNPGSYASDSYGTIHYAYFSKILEDGSEVQVDVYHSEKASTPLLIIIYA